MRRLTMTWGLFEDGGESCWGQNAARKATGAVIIMSIMTIVIIIIFEAGSGPVGAGEWPEEAVVGLSPALVVVVAAVVVGFGQLATFS